MEPRWGIKIAYEVKYDKNQDPVDLRATFLLGNGTTGRDFVSNKEIRKAIGKLRRRNMPTREAYVGVIHMGFNPATRTGTFITYYPLDYRGRGGKFFQSAGIAQLLELKFLIETKRRYPALEKIRDFHPSDARKEHLRKRGIDWSKPYSYEEAITKLKEKIRKDATEHRKPRSISRRVRIKRIMRRIAKRSTRR